MFHRILVGIDGSEGGQRALERAADLAALCKADLLVVSIEEKLPAYAATVGEVQDEERYEHRYFRQIQHEARRLAEGRGVPVHFEVIAGHPAVPGSARVGAPVSRQPLIPGLLTLVIDPSTRVRTMHD